MKLTTLKKVRVIFCLTHMCTAYHGWATDDPMTEPTDINKSNTDADTAIIGGDFEIISAKEANTASLNTSLHKSTPSGKNSIWTWTLGLVLPTQKSPTHTRPSMPKKATKSDLLSVDSTQQKQLLSAQNTAECIAEHITTLADEQIYPQNTNFIIDKETNQPISPLVAPIHSTTEHTSESNHEGEVDDPLTDHLTSLIPELVADENDDQAEIRPIDNIAITSLSGIAPQQHTTETILIEPSITIETNHQSSITDRQQYAPSTFDVSLLYQEGEGSSFFTTATVVAAIGFSAIILPHLLKQWAQK